MSVGHAASPESARFRLKLCSQAPIHLPGPPGAGQSRGCVAAFKQELTDPATYASALVAETGGMHQYIQMTDRGVVGVGVA